MSPFSPPTTTDRLFSSNWQLLEEKVGSNTKTRNVWSPVYVDAMVTRDRDTDANGTLDERLYALQDANFNVTAITNTSGTVQEKYTETPFGATTFRNSSGTAIGSSTKDWVFLHQGGQADIIGDLDFRNRVLSPTLGRWLSNDPLGFDAGDVNTYRYLENTPFSGTDPFGLDLLKTIKQFNDQFPGSPPILPPGGTVQFPIPNGGYGYGFLTPGGDFGGGAGLPGGGGGGFTTGPGGTGANGWLPLPNGGNGYGFLTPGGDFGGGIQLPGGSRFGGGFGQNGNYIDLGIPLGEGGWGNFKWFPTPVDNSQQPGKHKPTLFFLQAQIVW